MFRAGMWSRAGFWAAYDTTGDVSPCAAPNPEARCTGWSVALGSTSCGTGYLQGSHLCGACAPGYFLDVSRAQVTRVASAPERESHAWTLPKPSAGRRHVQRVSHSQVRLGPLPHPPLRPLRYRGHCRRSLGGPAAARAPARRDTPGRRRAHARPLCVGSHLSPGSCFEFTSQARVGSAPVSTLSSGFNRFVSCTRSATSTPRACRSSQALRPCPPRRWRRFWHHSSAPLPLCSSKAC